MSDEIAPFEDEPLTVEEACENLTRAVSIYNAAINSINGMPVSAVANFCVLIDERLYTEDGVVPEQGILEPATQPSFITEGLIKAVYEKTAFATIDYDPDIDDD